MVDEIMEDFLSRSTGFLMKRIVNTLIQSLASIATVLIMVSSSRVMAADSYLKQWDSAVFTGSIRKSNYQYYLETQIRFIDDPYLFNQSLLIGGLGYRFNSSLTIYACAGWIVDKLITGKLENEIRFVQQINSMIYEESSFSVSSRTRFEERKKTEYSEIAYRFRERLWLRIPYQYNPVFSFSFFDEIFLDLNHPQWVSPDFISQNRAFVGMGYQYSPHITIDVGYMNQLLISRRNQVDHVLLFLFSINH
jgi:Protein of unknown function (DUF2490)